MLKKVIIVLIVGSLVYFVFNFLKSGEESVTGYFREKVLMITEAPKETGKEFLDERREAVESEIEKEKEKAGEKIKETGRSLWQSLGDYIFNLVGNKNSDEQ